MKINMYSIFVEDQQKALDFYTNVLGFEKKQDIPVGEYRWMTVVSPEGGDTELSLEPNVNADANVFQKAMFEQGIPFTGFEVDDLDAEFKRLTELGVAFTTKPTPAGDVAIATFADTCGNLIQLYERTPGETG
ncbi:MAG: VOC family protein [Pseudomonadota bacterium]